MIFYFQIRLSSEMEMMLLIFPILIISSVTIESTPIKYWSTEGDITETESTRVKAPTFGQLRVFSNLLA